MKLKRATMKSKIDLASKKTTVIKAMTVGFLSKNWINSFIIFLFFLF